MATVVSGPVSGRALPVATCLPGVSGCLPATGLSAATFSTGPSLFLGQSSPEMVSGFLPGAFPGPMLSGWISECYSSRIVQGVWNPSVRQNLLVAATSYSALSKTNSFKKLFETS